MTRLAETALDFCRDVLGWEDVREDGIGLYVYSYPDRPKKLLHYGDLNAVVAAVTDWCDRTDGAVEVSYYGYVPGEWEVQVVTPVSVESVVHADLCVALLAACVEASRKLKSA